MTISEIKEFCTNNTFNTPGEPWNGADNKSELPVMANGFEPGVLPAEYLNYILAMHNKELYEQQMEAPVLPEKFFASYSLTGYGAGIAKSWHILPIDPSIVEWGNFSWLKNIAPGGVIPGVGTTPMYLKNTASTWPSGKTPLHCTLDPVGSGYSYAQISNPSTSTCNLYLYETSGAIAGPYSLPANSHLSSHFCSAPGPTQTNFFGSNGTNCWRYTLFGSTQTFPLATGSALTVGSARLAFSYGQTAYFLSNSPWDDLGDYKCSIFRIPGSGSTGVTYELAFLLPSIDFYPMIFTWDRWNEYARAVFVHAGPGVSDSAVVHYRSNGADFLNTWIKEAEFSWFGPEISATSGTNIAGDPVPYRCVDSIWMGSYAISIFRRDFGSFQATFLVKHSKGPMGVYYATAIRKFDNWPASGYNVSITRTGKRTLMISMFALISSTDFQFRCYELKL